MSKPVLSILFVSTEVDPYATKAGLAQVAGSLPQAIKDLDDPDFRVDIRVIMPKYGNEELRALAKQRPFRPVVSGVKVPFGGLEFDVAVQRDSRFGVVTYFVDNEEFFGCDPRIYWPSEVPRPGCGNEIPNIRRFAFFSRAVLEAIRRTPFRPDVIHCNDWHTALIPVYLGTLYALDPFYRDPAGQGHYTGSVLTWHNVGRGFQGIWPLRRKPDLLERAGLAAYRVLYDPERGLTHSALPNRPDLGEINLFRGGIIYADRVNTVSPTYKEEMLRDPVITGSEGWCDHRYDYRDNLLDFLQDHRDKLSGIVNGIDYVYHDGEQPKGWDPETDTCIAENYSVRDLDAAAGRIPHKDRCKLALQSEIGLPADETIPLIGLLGRLESQKGIVLLLDDLGRGAGCRLKALGVQLLICGKPGEDEEGQRIRRELSSCAQANSDWLKVNMTFVPEKFVHRLFAGCDMILMPSEYEPCGTPQLQGHRYGAIPVVRKTGGLADTVTDGVDGFVFESAPWGTDKRRVQRALESQLSALERAVKTYRDDRPGWGDLIRQAMNRDHSWAASARQYLELYKQAQQSAQTRQPETGGGGTSP